MIIGQEKICTKIDNLTLDQFPRSLMLVGARGSGKHLICKYIAERFNLTAMDITDTLNLETIEELYNRVEPYQYIIRVNEISIKEENVILKFLEEPLKNSYIVLLAETDNGLLQTILNRCQIWYLQNYTHEYLQTFLTSGNTYVLSIANTPGRVKELNNVSFDEMIDLANKMLTKIETANISNTLSLSNKISFKQEKEALDGFLFVEVLTQELCRLWIAQPDVRLAIVYSELCELRKQLNIKNLDYKMLFENFLIRFRSIMRGGK